MMSVVLVEPEKAGNIGAVARAMKNFDFKDLILINPKADHLSKESMDRASHAKDVLKKAKKADISYLEGFDHIIGTTSKLGSDYNMPRVPITPKQLAEKLSETGKKSRIALLFGRECTGLTNEEIKRCDFIVSIPSSKRYPAMNLSHSVAILLYEIYSAQGKNKIGDIAAPITDIEKKQILKMVDDILDSMEFGTKEKKETQRILWKRMIGKSFMTRREAFALMGFLKKIK
ncbi:MAG: RNA methyltransferase [Nanoarchaeota archaeon]|nr:RNA methyltransferase [Nanoarchaeota archaeon]